MSNDKIEDGEKDEEDFRFQDYEHYNEQSRSLVRVREVPSEDLPDDFQEDHHELSPVEPQEDATFPVSALQRARTNQHYSRGASVIGMIVRVILVLGITAEDTASIADLLFYLSSFLPFVMPIVVVLIATGILSLGDLAVTWIFWTPAVQEWTAVAVDRVIQPCYPRILAQVQSVNNELGFWNRIYRFLGRVSHFVDRISRSLPGLIGISICASAAALGSVANENEEGLRILIGWVRATLLTGLFGLGLGLIATVYSGQTDLSFLWRRRTPGRAVERPSNFIYVMAFLGTLEYLYRMGVVGYLVILERWDTRLGAALISTISNLLGAIPILLYQTVVAIERSPLLLRIKLFLYRLPLPAKILFLSLIGLNTILQNLSLTYFNMSTLLPDIFNNRFGYSIDQAWFNLFAIIIAVLVAVADVLTSFMDGVVSATMGWDQPDNLFLAGVRSQPLYGRRSLRFTRNEGFFSQPSRVTVLSEEEGQALCQLPGDRPGRLEVSVPRAQEGQELRMLNTLVHQDDSQMTDQEDVDNLLSIERK